VHPHRIRRCGVYFTYCVLLLLFSPGLSASFKQEAYLWQRQWTPRVINALLDSPKHFDGIQILAAEITWDDDGPHTHTIAYDHHTLNKLNMPLTLVLRIGPCSASFLKGTPANEAVLLQSRKLLETAQEYGIPLAEFQVDFDCAEKKLANYRVLLESIQILLVNEYPGITLSFTALPSWLKHSSDFRKLAAAADSFVLQVHSLEKPTTIDAPLTLCDPPRSLEWIRMASSIGAPFRVALPTYAYEVVYDAHGNFQRLMAEGTRTPPRTGEQVRIVRSDPAAMAELAQTIRQTAFPQCTGIIWFRLPVPGDRLNWASRTLQVILDGGIPSAHLQANTTWDKNGLVTLSLLNSGDTAMPLPQGVQLSWETPPSNVPIAWDGMDLFTITLDPEQHSAHIDTSALPASASLAPGQQLEIAWIRFPQPCTLSTHLIHDL